jgi:hypothetical protein
METGATKQEFFFSMVHGVGQAADKCKLSKEELAVWKHVCNMQLGKPGIH